MPALSIKLQESIKMSMTTPVISSGGGAKMSFVMPSSYWRDLSRAPRPVPAAGSVVAPPIAPVPARAQRAVNAEAMLTWPRRAVT